MYFDVILVGAGLSGLTAALRLQNLGFRTAIIEQRDQVGGLCGTFIHRGHEFVIACNDFGQGLKNELDSLACDFKFLTPRSRFYFAHTSLEIPATFRTMWHLLPYFTEIIKLIRVAKKEKIITLGTLLEQHCRSMPVADMACLIGYATGRTPQDINLRHLGAEFDKKFNYGYEQPITPKGGTQALSQQLANDYIKRGGRLFLNQQVEHIERTKSVFKVQTSIQNWHAQKVISSKPHPDFIAQPHKTGLPLSMLLIAARDQVPYPVNHHTICHFPAHATHWMKQLDMGVMPEQFGFHIFKSDLINQTKTCTMNVYFYLPRGMMRPSKTLEVQIYKYIWHYLELMIPGMKPYILDESFVWADDFLNLHQLSSTPMPMVHLEHNYKKPASLDSSTGIYHIGNSVFPYGEHIGAAVVSARLAVEQITQEITPSHIQPFKQDTPMQDQKRKNA